MDYNRELIDVLQKVLIVQGAIAAVLVLAHAIDGRMLILVGVLCSVIVLCLYIATTGRWNKFHFWILVAGGIAAITNVIVFSAVFWLSTG